MRVNVNLSDEMNSRVEYYSKKFGVSKSQLCSMMVGQGILGYEKSFEMMDSMKDVAGKEIFSALQETVDKK